MPITRHLRSEFLRNIATVFSGTLVAQMIPVLVAPVLTRYFTPGDLGLYEVFVSLAAIVMTLITGRFEMAVILPEKDDDALALVAASLLTALAASLLLTGGALLFRHDIAALLSLPDLAPWLPFLPMFSFVGSAFFTLTYWFARKKRFGDLAARKIVQNSATAAVQVSGGAASLSGPFPLIGGAFTGYLAGTALFLFRLFRSDGAALRSFSVSLMPANIRRYREFPLLTLPAQLINIVANQIPAVIFAAFFGPAAAGGYALTRRVLATPIQLVAESVSDVFRQRANADYLSRGTCRPIVLRTMLLLAALATPPFVLLMLFGPPLFALIFGEPWREAGLYAAILSPLFLSRFVAAPLSYVLLIAGRQGVNLAWQTLLLAATVSSFIVGAGMGSGRWALALFSGNYAALYLLLALASWYYAKRPSPV